MQRLKDEDRGSVAVIVALLMVVIVAVTALAIDVGAMHSDRQQLQTGADAGALAIAQDCATDNCGNSDATAQEMAQANFLGDGATGKVVSLDFSDKTVQVGTSAIREHWFAPIIGIDSTRIHATATAQWEDPAQGSPQGSPLLPLAIPRAAATDVSTSEVLRVNKSSHEGAFGWLVTSAEHCGQMPAVSEDGWVIADPGNSDRRVCESFFPHWIGASVLVPIFDESQRDGGDVLYQLSGYVQLKLTSFDLSGNWHIEGVVEDVIDIDGLDGTSPQAPVVTLID
ncbi:MAG TPA: Tad domain-containing protein [Enteractinococcus sp.]